MPQACFRIAFMNDWNIQSRAHACQSCEKHFSDKETFHTLLLDERAGLRRMDICPTCWDSKYKNESGHEKGFISYWHSVYEIAPPPPPEAIQKESAETLLRKLMEVNDPRYSATCYILAVMLERKRILKVKEQLKRDGRRIFIYEHPKSGDFFTITDPDLQLDQLEQVQTDVADLLENGIPQPEIPAASNYQEPIVTEGESSEAFPLISECGCEATEARVEVGEIEAPDNTERVLEPNPV
ncbi:MAG: hypothetical protein JWM04_2365 [Verrucomicrobiales bacterium]|nr:hypothetical protein [Verrucomicrobiales bacterium]